MKYDIFTLDEIKKRLSSAQLVRERKKWYGEQDHTRWVFFDGQNDQCIKLWNDTYVRKECVQQAIEGDFYDENLIPAFRGLIYDSNEQCRGYVTQRCENINVDAITWKRVLDYVKQKTKETRLFAYDFVPEHIMLYKKENCEPKINLIDLEGVYPIEEYSSLHDIHIKQQLQKSNNLWDFSLPYMSTRQMFMKNTAYEEYIIELLHSN